MLNKKFNLVTLLITSAVCSTIAILIYVQINNYKASNTEAAKTIEDQTSSSCDVVAHRLEGYKFIKPLLYNNKTCESGKYYGLKLNIEDAIKKYQQAGNIDNASVYLKVLNNREFINVNENQVYHPASLIKLPILITYLEMEEKNPGTLNKKFVYHLPPGGLPNQTYKTNQIQPEKSYTVKELLNYMIAYSDNNATFLLNKNIDLEAFKKMFSDFGLTVPNIYDSNFEISASDYSVFLNVIYNAGYLTIPNSEFVAELLSKCDFKEGLQSGIPSDTKIIHKFGEWGSRENPNIHQLSESGIIYLDNSPYILTVMAQGKEVNKLPGVIGNISKTVYEYLKTNAADL